MTVRVMYYHAAERDMNGSPKEPTTMVVVAGYARLLQVGGKAYLTEGSVELNAGDREAADTLLPEPPGRIRTTKVYSRVRHGDCSPDDAESIVRAMKEAAQSMNGHNLAALIDEKVKPQKVLRSASRGSKNI